MTRRVVLVGCGKAKHDGQLPAKEKYSSNYFTLKRQYAEKIGDDWAIISAKYGLVDPDQEIDDYDITVREMDEVEAESWGLKTGSNLVAWISDLQITSSDVDELHLLLGSAYQEPLTNDLEWLEERTDIELVRPFDDTSGIGEQMSVLKDAIEA